MIKPEVLSLVMPEQIISFRVGAEDWRISGSGILPGIHHNDLLI